MTHALHELFCSLQGEGRNTGRPCIFLRFAGCNLACPWCDTDHTPKFRLKTEALLNRLADLPERNIILTGGEPLIQPGLLPLVRELKARNYWVAIETNGTREPEPELRDLLDYIATSPKLGAPLALQAANEVRLVVAPGITPAWCRTIRSTLPAADYYLSPCDTHGSTNLLETLQLLGQLNADNPTPPWLLSLQTHKLCNIR